MAIIIDMEQLNNAVMELNEFRINQASAPEQGRLLLNKRTGEMRFEKDSTIPLERQWVNVEKLMPPEPHFPYDSFLYTPDKMAEFISIYFNNEFIFTTNYLIVIIAAEYDVYEKGHPKNVFEACDSSYVYTLYGIEKHIPVTDYKRLMSENSCSIEKFYNLFDIEKFYDTYVQSAQNVYLLNHGFDPTEKDVNVRYKIDVYQDADKYASITVAIGPIKHIDTFYVTQQEITKEVLFDKPYLDKPDEPEQGRRP